MLKNIRALASDSLIYGSTTILSQFIGLVLVPFYTKELSPKEYGIISLVALFISFLAPLVTLGMESALFRYFAITDDKEERIGYFTTASIVKTIFLVGVFFLLLPFYDFVNNQVFGNQLLFTHYLLFLGTFFFDNITSLAFVILRSDRKVMQVAGINLAVLLVSLGASIYLVLIIKWGVTGVLLAAFIAAVVRAVLFTRYIVSNFKITYFNKETLKKLMRYGLPLVPHKIQARIIGLFTLFIINQQLGLVVAGLYVVSKKFSKPLFLIVSTVQQAWSPYKFQIHKEEKKPVPVFRNLISFYWILLIFLWASLCIAVPPLFKALIDVRYWEGIPYVPFITFLGVLEAFRFTVSTGFELSDRQKMASVASFWGLAALVGLSFLTLNFFPPYGFFVAQAAAYIVMGSILFREARKIMVIDYPFRKIFYFALINFVAIFYYYQSTTLLASILVSFVVFANLLITVHSIFSLQFIRNAYAIVFRKFSRKAR